GHESLSKSGVFCFGRPMCPAKISFGQKAFPNRGLRGCHRSCHNAMTPLFSNEIEAFVRSQLERMLTSRSFALSDRQSRLLRFLVEQTLAGKGPSLKESVVGVEVFGKAIDYDPKVDSTVRSEVVKLRARLAEYYSADGSADPWVIRIPKGTYVPTFEQPAAT